MVLVCLQVASTQITPAACNVVEHTMVNQVNHKLIFGKLSDGVSGNNGQVAIDEILIYEVVLSATEVNNLYNSFP